MAKGKVGPGSRRMFGRPGVGLRAGVALAATSAAFALLASVAPAAVGALPSNCVQSGTTVTCSYADIGAEQTFSVPAGVSEVSITAVGAPGGNDGGSSGYGGNGAAVSAVVPLPAGTSTLYVEVGGPGSASGGFNGGGNSGSGGGGGGASDVRTCSASVCSLSSNDTRLVVAGGGGGSTAHACPPQTTTPGGYAGDSAVSGAGAGGAGTDSCPADGSGGDAGFGGTAGGQGGAGTTTFPCDGGSGSLGQGGSDPTTCDPSDIGGGGGGGYWGGGAGGDGNDVGGGGGAGSSYWVPDATATSMTEDTTDTPKVVITYTAPTTGQPDLSLTNRADLNPVVRGHKLTYTIKPANTGTATASDVKLSDSLPASVRFVSVSSPSRCKHSGGQNGMGGRVTCNLGSFAAGKRATIELAVTPTKAGPLSDTAKVTAAGVTPDGDDTATAKTEVKNP